MTEFRCNRWLATDESRLTSTAFFPLDFQTPFCRIEDDGQTHVTLYPTDSTEETSGKPYTISIKTGDLRGADTNSKVYIELCGGKGKKTESSDRIYLTDGKFKRGRTDIFKVNVKKNISPLKYIMIGHDNSGVAPGWFCDHVAVACDTTGVKQVFTCMKWLAVDEDDGKIERILYENTSLREVHTPKTQWLIRVFTSDMPNAGTDANVTVVIYGREGRTDDIQLKTKGNMFERGQCDKFKVETDDIGQPFKMRVSHDNSGRGPGWHLDRIEAENLNTGEGYVFTCNKWLAKDEGDQQIIRELPAEGKHSYF